MPPSSLKVLARYHYDPLDRLMGVELLARVSTRRFYQQHYLATELDGQGQRSIMRHAAQPLAQHQSMAGISETTLLTTDQAHSLLQTLTGTHLQSLAYTAYGHHPAESGLSRLLGFNGECPDSITGHYLLGQGNRAYNPVLMRFNSPDDLSPFGEGGINPYAYCGNDPINFYDSSGNMRYKVLMQGRTGSPKSPQHEVQKTATTITNTNTSQSPSMRPSRSSASTSKSNTDSFSGGPSSSSSHTYTTTTKKDINAAEKRLNEDARTFDKLSQEYPHINFNIKNDPNLLKVIEETKEKIASYRKAGKHTKIAGQTERLNRTNKRIKQLKLKELMEILRKQDSNNVQHPSKT